jgi:murein DD-endopeptidase MepM/ murein hydrolase activator NlpD
MRSRTTRPLLGTILLTVLLAVAEPVAAGTTCWLPPVAADVVDPYREPECRWCPGNRGLEYRTPADAEVRAVATGTVVFSGTVAGAGYLVVRHADGRRATYGNLAQRRFVQGEAVARGVVVGRTAGRFHFGLRDGDRYIDPAPSIGRLVGVVRLVPVDGTAPAPAPQPRLSCRPARPVGIGPAAR